MSTMTLTPDARPNHVPVTPPDAPVRFALAWVRLRTKLDRRIPDVDLLDNLAPHRADPSTLWSASECATVRVMLRADGRALRILITYPDGMTVRVKQLLTEGWGGAGAMREAA